VSNNQSEFMHFMNEHKYCEKLSAKKGSLEIINKKFAWERNGVQINTIQFIYHLDLDNKKTLSQVRAMHEIGEIKSSTSLWAFGDSQM
jgi:hypothetical protein